MAYRDALKSAELRNKIIETINKIGMSGHICDYISFANLTIFIEVRRKLYYMDYSVSLFHKENDRRTGKNIASAHTPPMPMNELLEYPYQNLTFMLSNTDF